MTEQFPQQPYPTPPGPPQPQKKPTSPWVWLALIAVVIAVLWGGCAALMNSGGATRSTTTTVGGSSTTADNGITVATVEPLSETTRKQLANRACQAELQLPSGAQFMDKGQAALAMKDGSDKVIVTGKILLASGDRRSWRCEVIVLDDRSTQVLEVGLL